MKTFTIVEDEAMKDERLDTLQKMLAYHQRELALQQKYIDGIIEEIQEIHRARLTGQGPQG